MGPTVKSTQSTLVYNVPCFQAVEHFRSMFIILLSKELHWLCLLQTVLIDLFIFHSLNIDSNSSSLVSSLFQCLCVYCCLQGFTETIPPSSARPFKPWALVIGKFKPHLAMESWFIALPCMVLTTHTFILYFTLFHLLVFSSQFYTILFL